ALQQYLTQIALEDTRLFMNPHAPSISGVALEQLVMRFNKTQSLIARLSQRYPSVILQAMMRTPVLSSVAVKDEASLKEWLAALEKNMEIEKQNGQSYQFSIEKENELHGFIPTIHVSLHGVENTYRLYPEFFQANEYQFLMQAGAEFQNLLEPGAYVMRGDKQFASEDFKAILEWLMQEAKRGQQIQRYKGLGEMNADQLWSTTMDPTTRRLLQVRVEDAISADQIFTTLMGDQVEPRRDFIEANALHVENLDV
ncbi:MAG TPA: DNA gyrase subunit B, partial [Candidatus Berkiella sp.]|nr:DNA gyrase subunit B [Candidatus Berkiella sp.]